VTFFPNQPAGREIIISGSVDKTIRIWRRADLGDDEPPMQFREIEVLRGHTGSINAITTAPGTDIFVTGSADATVKVWQLQISRDDTMKVELLQTIELTPRFFPLALALSVLPTTPGSLVLAVTGTKSLVQIYVNDSMQGAVDFSLQASLVGHDGWIRSLAFKREDSSQKTDLLLASASQDKYIRLWRVHQGEELPPAAAKEDKLGATANTLSNKAHRFSAGGLKYSVTFEALLFGHEDWIYTARWQQDTQRLQLLSASADNSLAIWEPDESSGIWVCVDRLGEISAQKGSTSATGSTGGFWSGLWSPNGLSVVSLGRTGSWRVWKHDKEQERWVQEIGISGHVKDATSVSWGKDGKYLVSTSHDQTTRLIAEWKRGLKRSWHEFARPQIHGYDINCMTTLGSSRIVSGADEKLLRVFDEPKGVASLLEKLCGISEDKATRDEMPEAANIPMLGLSNKAIGAVSTETPILPDTHTRENERGADDPVSTLHASVLDIDSPPFEDHLARHTLWPEHEKLYGHGYEICAVAASHDGSLVATACKASSLEHAVIRVFETKEWNEIKPALTAHTLTVTSLAFSGDDQFLLSVGRDRQWAVFRRDVEDENTFGLAYRNEKGHSRMILDCAWAPVGAGRVFATAGRDKCVKIWAASDGEGFELKMSIPINEPATAVDFLQDVVDESLHFAVGGESGNITLFGMFVKDFKLHHSSIFDRSISPPRSISQLTWRPSKASISNREVSINDAGNDFEIAVASEDSSVRIYSISSIGR
jgi:elongator complex protein 2